MSSEAAKQTAPSILLAKKRNARRKVNSKQVVGRNACPLGLFPIKNGCLCLLEVGVVHNALPFSRT